MELEKLYPFKGVENEFNSCKGLERKAFLKGVEWQKAQTSWVDASTLPPVNTPLLIKFNKNEIETGDYWKVKELIENGWLDVKWINLNNL